MKEKFTFLFGGLNVSHPDSFEMSRPFGVPNHVFLSIKSPAIFTINGKTTEVSPNTVVIIEPFCPYFYHNPNGQYIDDWFHFKCKDESIFTKMQLSTNHFIPIFEQTNINLLVQELMWESNYTSNEVRDENLSLLIQVLLNNLVVSEKNSTKDQKYTPYNKKIKELRIKIQSYPGSDYQASEMAQYLGISVSYFQHLYKDLFGISFQKDVIRIRIDYAKQLISITNLPITEISKLCGYTSEVHFYRQFKKVTGITPSHYRSLESNP